MNFDALLRPILESIAKLWARVDLVPVVRWATITQVAPVRIRVDGDAADLAVTPQLVVGGLLVGDRVVCIEQHRRMIVIQMAGGGRATQAEVTAGTDNSRYVTPATLKNRAYAPYAMAAGRGTTATSGAVTVTLPAGRFTQPPRISVTPGTHPNVLTPRVAADPTATSFQIQTFTMPGGAQAAANFDWIAVQMTAGSGSG